MNEPNCDEVLMLKMAEADGEKVEVSDEANLHFKHCETCRDEFAQMQAMDKLMMTQARQQHNVDIWPLVEKRIAVSRIGWVPFAVLAVVLVGYKLFELLPEQGPGLAFKLVPLAIAVAVFFVIKENPFRVNTELTLER